MSKDEEIETAWRLHRGVCDLPIEQARAQLARAHAAQDGACYYCGREAFVAQDSASRKTFGHRAATREHLRRRADGGSDRDSNIVMACAGCNSTRGRRSPEFWRLMMQCAAASGTTASGLTAPVSLLPMRRGE